MPGMAYDETVGTIVRDHRPPSAEMLRSDVNVIARDVGTLKEDVAGLKRDVRTLKNDLTDVKGKVSAIESQLLELKGDLREAKVELKGDMKALWARMDGSDKQIYALDKRIDDLHQSQTKWFMLLGLLVAVVPLAIAVVQSFMTR